MLSCFSRVQLFDSQLFETLMDCSHQVPLSIGLSRQEYWSGLPFPPPGNLPDPGIEPASLTSPTGAGGFFTTVTCAWSLIVFHSLRHHRLYPSRFLCPWGFFKQKYWSGLPCPPPGDLPNPGIKPGLPHCRQILYCLSNQGSH